MTVHTPESAVARGEHAAHFYEHDAELAETVGGLLADALADGAVVIIIATEAHRRAFEAELDATGIDVAGAFAHGTLVALDAAATLAAFMRDGRIDAEGFDHVIGGLVREAAETGRPICAYGEMVGLLWDSGDVLGAIELEKRWNELGREVRFSLHCGYRSDGVSAPEHEHALHEICSLHGAVVHKHEVTGQFPARSDSPLASRRLVTDALGRWGHDDTALTNAQLVVSELASNAVVHAGTEFTLYVRREGSGLRISVRDASRVEPSPGNPDQRASSGRGLWLVSRLAKSWGVELSEDGKTVWAEL